MADDDDLDWSSLTLDPAFEVDRRVIDIIRHVRAGGKVSPEQRKFVWDRLGPMIGATTAEQAANYLKYRDPDAS